MGVAQPVHQRQADFSPGRFLKNKNKCPEVMMEMGGWVLSARYARRRYCSYPPEHDEGAPTQSPPWREPMKCGEVASNLRQVHQKYTAYRKSGCQTPACWVNMKVAQREFMSATRSILRYPGSKARLVQFIEESMALNNVESNVFAEPFCGGASVSISLLERQIVENIALNDADPLIANLWQTVFSSDAQWLADAVMTVPLTIDEWLRQKALVPSTIQDSALKGLYLNRTSFNGIIHKAGPLGGWGQVNRTLGARFNREKLSKRILELSRLRNRVVSIHNLSWLQFCETFTADSKPIFYLDPPYYYKADALYGYFFQLPEHVALHNYLKSLDADWMLSYDDAKEIRQLYERHISARVIDNTYSAHPIGGASFIGRELFFSNLKQLPAPKEINDVHVGMSVKSFVPALKPMTELARRPLTVAAHMLSAPW